METSAFEPRSGDLAPGGIPWLARMIDKARADAGGTIGEYMYPCPMDQALLAELRIGAEEFQRIALDSKSDDDVVRALGARAKAGRP